MCDFCVPRQFSPAWLYAKFRNRMNVLILRSGTVQRSVKGSLTLLTQYFPCTIICIFMGNEITHRVYKVFALLFWDTEECELLKNGWHALMGTSQHVLGFGRFVRRLELIIHDLNQEAT